LRIPKARRTLRGREEFNPSPKGKIVRKGPIRTKGKASSFLKFRWGVARRTGDAEVSERKENGDLVASWRLSKGMGQKKKPTYRPEMVRSTGEATY